MYYISLSDAIDELKKRKKDKELNRRLKEKIECFGSEYPIDGFSHDFCAFLLRNISTCRLEDICFFQRCQQVGLVPIWGEFKQDIFVTNNPSKMRLIRLKVYIGKGKKGGDRVEFLKIVKDPTLWQGRPIFEIKTNWGEDLASFHHRLSDAVFKEKKRNIIDFSEWLTKFGSAKDYYKPLFLIFVAGGILFESFESRGFPTLWEFKRRVVFPAWEWVISQGFPPPLIVLHPDCKPEEEEKILNYYPSEVMNFL